MMYIIRHHLSANTITAFHSGQECSTRCWLNADAGRQMQQWPSDESELDRSVVFAWLAQIQNVNLPMFF